MLGSGKTKRSQQDNQIRPHNAWGMRLPVPETLLKITQILVVLRIEAKKFHRQATYHDKPQGGLIFSKPLLKTLYQLIR